MIYTLFNDPSTIKIFQGAYLGGCATPGKKGVLLADYGIVHKISNILRGFRDFSLIPTTGFRRLSEVVG